jgi:type III secretory pathway component EscT
VFPALVLFLKQAVANLSSALAMLFFSYDNLSLYRFLPTSLSQTKINLLTHELDLKLAHWASLKAK